jgi:hypothetical protein
MLDIWPAFLLVVHFYDYPAKPSEDHFDNFVAALERRDRVHEIIVSDLPDFVWDRITTAVQEPFSALTTLDLKHIDGLAVCNIFFEWIRPEHTTSSLTRNFDPKTTRVCNSP